LFGFQASGYSGDLDVKLEIARRERGYSSEWEISVDGKNLSIFSVEFVLKRFEKG